MSPLFKQQLQSAKDRERARALENLLEANAHWNNTRRDTFVNGIRQKVDKTSTINLDLRKELLYLCERRFIEDKPIEECGILAPNLLQKEQSRTRRKTLKNRLMGKVIAETLSTVKTAAGSINWKDDIAKAKVTAP